MTKLEYTLAPGMPAQRLNLFLRTQGLTAGLIKAVKYDGGGFFCNGAPVHTDYIVRPGQTVSFALPPEPQTDVVPQDIPLHIAYEDAFAAVLDKPAGIAVHPTLNYPDGTLANGWLHYLQTQGRSGVFRPVNRLDKNTSGLVLCAQNAFAAPALAASAEKTYLAVAAGTLPQRHGFIEAPIGRQGDSIIGRWVTPNGKYSLTEYTVLAETDRYTLAACRLHTGRTHQIRVHMAYIGHPLAGDSLYGGPVQDIARQALHCAVMRFQNPYTHAPVRVQSPLPPDMAALLGAGGMLDKWQPDAL